MLFAAVPRAVLASGSCGPAAGAFLTLLSGGLAGRRVLVYGCRWPLGALSTCAVLVACRLGCARGGLLVDHVAHVVAATTASAALVRVALGLLFAGRICSVGCF